MLTFFNVILLFGRRGSCVLLKKKHITLFLNLGNFPMDRISTQSPRNKI